MKTHLRRALGVTCVCAAGLTAAAELSIQVSPPGVYGRIDLGNLPQPRLILPQPVIINATLPAPPVVRAELQVGQPPQPAHTAPRPPRSQPQPVYMWVPPGHQRDWKKHCQRYRACGVPVYFVHDDWYHQHVHPRGRGADRGRGHERGHDDDKGRGDKGNKGKGRD